MSRRRNSSFNARSGEPFSRSTGFTPVPRPVIYSVSPVTSPARQGPTWRDMAAPRAYDLFYKSAPRVYPTRVRSRGAQVRFPVDPKRRRRVIQISSKVPRWSDISRSLSVKVPSRIKFCVSRIQRRQVLFAMKRAGYSGSAPKRHYYRSQNSQYRC